MPTTHTDIRLLSKKELKSYFTSINEKAFRAKQVEEWLWAKQANSFEEMTNLSKNLREHLAENFSIQRLQAADIQNSEDGTVKTAFKTSDEKVIEGVLIPTEHRMTACISSQVGCSLTCKFCATGKLKRLRNLTGAEIFDQVVEIKRQAEEYYDQPLTNIVYMGMGEPLLNYKGMMESVDRITNDMGLGMSPKRITVSTAGIAKMIKRLGDDEVKFNLALSLHAADDKKRSEIMPINDQNNLEVLMEALQYFHEKTGQKITYEYIIFKDFNDSIEDAKKLVKYCGRVPSKVNIIEYNPIGDGVFQKADSDKVDAFADYLGSKGVIAKVRRSRGKDIDAACGQLANKNKAVFA